MGKILRFAGLGCLGVLATVGLATLTIVGVAAGMFWYLSRSPDIRITFTFPMEGGQARVDITNDASRLGQEIERMLQQGKIQGQVDILGPGDVKLMGVRTNMDVPIERILGPVINQFLGGGLGGGGGVSTQDILRLLGGAGGGGSVPRGLPATPTPVVSRPASPPAAPTPAIPGQPTPRPAPTATPAPLTPEAILNMTPQERLAIAPDLLGEDANKTLPQILATTPEADLRASLGPNYREVLGAVFAGKGDKTLGQVFAEDPIRLLPLLLGGR